MVRRCAVRSTLGAVALWLAATGTSSCGGAAAPVQAPASPGLRPSAAAPPAPELGPVPAPTGLVASLRVAKPAALALELASWLGPSHALPADQWAELLTDDAVGPVLDGDQPLDVALTVSGTGVRLRRRFALSAGVRDPERAKVLLADRFKLVPGDSAGVLLLKPLDRTGQPADEGDSDTALSCELAPAFGASAVRVVCANDPAALGELGPWLTRTATRASTTADIHADVTFAPVRAAFIQQRPLLGSLLGSAVGNELDLPSARELVTALCGDLLDFAFDLDTISLDVTAAETGATASATVGFATTASTLARIETEHPERVGPPPDSFMSLPADADVAVFGRGLDEADIVHARDRVLALLGDGLAAYGLSEADRKPFLDAFARLASPAAAAYASGLDVGAVEATLRAARAAHDAGDAAAIVSTEQAAAQALLGWRVLALDEPSDRWTGALKQLSTAVSRPAFAATYRSRVGATAKPPSLRVVSSTKATASLPAGAVHYVLDLYPPPPASGGAPSNVGPHAAASTSAKPLSFHVFVVPRGDRSWIGMGGDEALVASKLETALGGAGQRLGAAPEIAVLSRDAVGTGGLFSVRGLTETAPQLEALLGSWQSAAEGIAALSTLPHAGAARMAFSVTARQGSPGMVLKWSVPRAAIDDAVAAFNRSAP